MRLSLRHRAWRRDFRSSGRRRPRFRSIATSTTPSARITCGGCGGRHRTKNLRRCCVTRLWRSTRCMRKASRRDFFELDARGWPDVNLSYFGLMPGAIGHGTGYGFPARGGRRGLAARRERHDGQHLHRRSSARAAELPARRVPYRPPGAANPEVPHASEPAHSAQPAALTATAGLTDALALYMHWPFCLAKCPYCDFNSHVRARHRSGTVSRRRYAVNWRPRPIVWAAARLTSVFFGGGTPSLMAPQTGGPARRRFTLLRSRSAISRDHPRSESDQHRIRTPCAISAPPVSTASRSASRASTPASLRDAWARAFSRRGDRCAGPGAPSCSRACRST